MQCIQQTFVIKAHCIVLFSAVNKEDETSCSEYITEGERGTNCPHLLSGKGYFGHTPRLKKIKNKESTGEGGNEGTWIHRLELTLIQEYFATHCIYTEFQFNKMGFQHSLTHCARVQNLFIVLLRLYQYYALFISCSVMLMLEGFFSNKHLFCNKCTDSALSQMSNISFFFCAVPHNI